MSKKLIKSVFQDDPEVMRALEARDTADMRSYLREIFRGEPGKTPVKGKDYFTLEEIRSFKKEILAGATPKKFKDYFTESEILHIMSEVRRLIVSDLANGLKEEITPKKGIDYVDGKDADEVAIIASILKEVQKTYPKIKEFDPKGIIKDLEDIKGKVKEIPTTASLLKEIKSKKLIERKDINGMPLNDQKWHGGGPTITLNGQSLSPQYAFSNINLLAGAGVTITTTQDTTNSRVNVTISATGGTGASVSAQIVTGTQVGDDLSVVLAQLSNPYTGILIVYINGQAIDPTRWSILAGVMTITQAYTSDSVQLLYTY